MLIIWGTKIVRKKLGRRADYCLLCRDFQPARVMRVKSVGHLYYIPLGFGNPVGVEQTCETCGLLRTLDNVDDDPNVSRDRHADVDTLMAETNPAARQGWSKRIVWDNAVRSGTMALGDRIAAMTESFELANHLVEARTATMNFDAVSGVGCLLTVAGGIGAVFATEALMKTNTDEALGIGVLVAITLGVITLILVARDGRRYTKRVVLPILVKAIRPMKPREEEIEQVLANLRSTGIKIAKLLTTHQVSEAMMYLAE